MRPLLAAFVLLASLACDHKPPSDAAPPTSTAPSSERDPEGPPSSGQADASAPPADAKVQGATCLAGKDCASGVCEGEGCDDAHAGVCAAEGRMCTRDLQQYCGCDGQSFGGSGSCPGRRFAHRGPC